MILSAELSQTELFPGSYGISFRLCYQLAHKYAHHQHITRNFKCHLVVSSATYANCYSPITPSVQNSVLWSCVWSLVLCFSTRGVVDTHHSLADVHYPAHRPECTQKLRVDYQNHLAPGELTLTQHVIWTGLVGLVDLVGCRLTRSHQLAPVCVSTVASLVHCWGRIWPAAGKSHTVP